MSGASPQDRARSELVEVARDLAAQGLSPGSSGNVSSRVGELILMSRTGARLAELTVDDLAAIDMAGEHVAGPPATKELPLHLALYRRDPATASVIHLHSPYAVAASCLEPWSAASALAPLTPYFVMRVGSTPLVPYAHPGDPRQAAVVEAMPGRFRAALLQRHGSIVAGADASSSAAAAIELEEACRLKVLLAGVPHGILSEDEALDLAERYGSVWDG